MFAGIANILDVLPQDDPNRPRLEKLFRDMAAKLKAIQKPDGYWAPSLLGPENSPPETSGTGFYVYGLAWGVKHGLLDAAEYRPAIDKGWAALTRAVAKDGRLGWVQQVSDRPGKRGRNGHAVLRRGRVPARRERRRLARPIVTGMHAGDAHTPEPSR